MKKNIILFILLCPLVALMAQKGPKEVTPDSLLYESFSKSELIKLQQEAPDKLLELNFGVTGFCYISDQKPANSQILGDICNFVSPGKTCDINKMISTKRINSLNYSLPQDPEKYNVFTISNSSYFVIVYPAPVFMQNKISYIKQFGF
jgi:hypothetical protein